MDDAGGSTLYDWNLISTAGEIYATRNSSTINWTNLHCANTSILNIENTRMSHTNPSDNISRTFSDSTHSEFFVGTVNISQNSCINSTLNTYVNNVSQNTDFEEIALVDGNATVVSSIVYATIIENRVNGFDNVTYDFQMIVPENGAAGFAGATAYYLYVELT